jgi:hypothetical protein
MSSAYGSHHCSPTGRKPCFYSATINRNHSNLKGFLMRTYALAIAAAAIFAFPASAFAQAVEIGPRGVEVEGLRPGRSVVGPVNCDELRKACLNKNELGEQGQGNCERYRERCGRD